METKGSGRTNKWAVWNKGKRRDREEIEMCKIGYFKINKLDGAILWKFNFVAVIKNIWHPDGVGLRCYIARKNECRCKSNEKESVLFSSPIGFVTCIWDAIKLLQCVFVQQYFSIFRLANATIVCNMNVP